MSEAHPRPSTIFFFDLKKLLVDDKRKILHSLAVVYKDVFNAKGEAEWGESWTVDGVIKSLTRDCDRPEIEPYLNLLGQTPDHVDGFAFGYNISKKDFGTLEMPYNLGLEESAALAEEIKDLIDFSKIFFFKELGLKQSARGGLQKILNLMEQIMRSAAMNGAEVILFWTSPRSKIFNLSQAFGAQPIKEVTVEGESIVFCCAPINVGLSLFEKDINSIIEKLRN